MTNEETLRRILAAEAGSVDVAPDALATIRARVARRQARWWHRWLPGRFALLGFTGGTAVVAAAAVALALATTPDVAPSPQTPAATAGRPTVDGALSTTNVPVYYLGTTSLGVRLFREYHVVRVDSPDNGTRARVALDTMLATNSPADADYRTPWRDATVASVRFDGDTVTVDLHGVRESPPPDAETARMAVQQLIWTATAASGTTALRVTFDGRARPSLWGVPGLDGRLERAPRADVQAPIWLIDPQQDAHVGHTFNVYVAGLVTGGTAHLRVAQPDGTVLSDQPVPLSATAPQLGEAHLQVTLPSGSYVVTAYLPGPAGGHDGDADTHRITVG
jgi:hypothetical protein